MDFSKYLPKYLIIKNVFNLENSTTHRYFISQAKDLNMKYFVHDKIKSWHPLIIKDGNNFYYLKGLRKQDFMIATFCLNNECFDQTYNNNILENYFEKNSFEI
ncbi:MAG: hypothetical protein KBS35_00500 [Mycoplasma sp.]|nr:hypothetical protein [Candidatus Hennigella equi]